MLRLRHNHLSRGLRQCSYHFDGRKKKHYKKLYFGSKKWMGHFTNAYHSTRTCSDNCQPSLFTLANRSPFAVVCDHKKWDASAAAIVPKAQQEPQEPWFLTAVVKGLKSHVLLSPPPSKTFDFGSLAELLRRGQLKVWTVVQFSHLKFDVLHRQLIINRRNGLPCWRPYLAWQIDSAHRLKGRRKG